MKTIGNIIWVIFGGLFWSIICALEGILCCITIIGIPVGLQMFKMSSFVLWPFGKQVKKIGNSSFFKQLVNLLWLIFFGWEMALGYLLTGILYCITIVGIPFGMQYFKLASFVLWPIGYDFY